MTKIGYFLVALTEGIRSALGFLSVVCVLAVPFSLVWSVNLYFNGPYYTAYDDTGEIVLESRLVAGVPAPGSAPQTMFIVTDEPDAQEACRRQLLPLPLRLFRAQFSTDGRDKPCYHTKHGQGRG